MYRVVILSCFIHSVCSQFFPIYYQCTSHTQCPAHSACGADACNGYRCLCEEGFAASNDLRTCLTAGNHSDACDSTVRCLGGIYALCRDNTCMCTGLARVTHINTCVSKGSARVVGATCSNQDTCVTNAECKDGTCQCKTGYRKKSTREFWVDPESREHCVPQDYSLDACNGVPLPTTTGLPTTTSITTTAASTSTTTLPTTTSTTTTSTSPTTTLVTAARIFASCTSSDQCPLGSTCSPNGCLGYNCLCAWGYTASEDRRACLTAGFLTSDCTSPTVKCLSPVAECKAGVCSCSDGYRLTPYNTCTFQGSRDLGELCTGDDQCGTLATCSIGYCQCAPGFRVKTAGEFWADPDSPVQCLPEDFSLDSCDNNPTLYTTTPSPSTTTSSTTTAAPTTTTDVSATTPTPPTTTVIPVLQIFENCTTNAQCPLRSSCRPNGCLGYNCLCDWGYAPSDDRYTCLSAGNVGATCQDGLIQCLSPLATCVEGICGCYGVYRTTTYNTCTFPGSRVLFETCTVGSSECGVFAECTSGICECSSGFRTKTTEEFWADPDSLVQCVPEGFSLYTCTSSLPTVSIPSSSPTTTVSTSVSTTATTVSTASTTTSVKTTPDTTATPADKTTTADEPSTSFESTTSTSLTTLTSTQDTTTGTTASSSTTTTTSALIDDTTLSSKPSVETSTVTTTTVLPISLSSTTVITTTMTTPEDETTTTVKTSTTEMPISTRSTTKTASSEPTVESSPKPSTTVLTKPISSTTLTTTTKTAMVSNTKISDTTSTTTTSTTTTKAPTSETTIGSSADSTTNTGMSAVSSDPQRENPIHPVNNDDGSKVAVIASACTAGFVLLIVIAVTVVLCHRRHRYKRRLEVTNDQTVLRTYDNVELPSSAAAYMMET